MSMTREERLNQLAEQRVLERRIERLQPGSQRIEFPAPKVINEVKTPEVHLAPAVNNFAPVNNVTQPENHFAPVNNVTHEVSIDTEPLAEVLEEYLKSTSESLNRLADQVAALAQLQMEMIKVVAAIKPTVTLPKLPIEVGVTLDAPAFPIHVAGVEATLKDERPKRTLQITHSDGSKSTIEEV